MIPAIIAAMVGGFMIERFGLDGVPGFLAFACLVVGLILLLDRVTGTDTARPSHGNR